MPDPMLELFLEKSKEADKAYGNTDWDIKGILDRAIRHAIDTGGLYGSYLYIEKQLAFISFGDNVEPADCLFSLDVIVLASSITVKEYDIDGFVSEEVVTESQLHTKISDTTTEWT